MSKTKGGGRCTGHCCKCVTIRKSPDELREAAEHARDARELRDDGSPKSEDEMLYEMLIPLGDFPTNPLMKVYGESWGQKALRLGTTADHRKGPDYNRQHFYACRNIKPNGDCGIYETRPHMCSSYPNGQLCSFEECTMPVDQQIEGSFLAPSVLVKQIQERGLIPPKSLLKKVKESSSRHLMEKVPLLDDLSHQKALPDETRTERQAGARKHQEGAEEVYQPTKALSRQERSRERAD